MPNEIQNKPKQTISFSNLPSIIAAVVFIVGIGAVFGLLGYLVSGIKENVTPVAQKPSVKVTGDYFGNDFIQVRSPQKNATVKNPVLISGKANVDEANVRVKITDDNKNILADTFITADGWMDKLYPFEKEISYKTPQTENGLIEIFEESARDGSEIYKIEVPVVFEDYEDAFSNWKVYRNEEFGFEFDYPEGFGWELIDGRYINSKEIILLNNKFNKGKFRMEINLKVTEGANLEENIKYWRNNGLVFIENFQLNDLVGKKLWASDTHTDSLIYLFNIKGEDTLFTFGITGVDTENHKYLISLFNEILSTFKFIEKEEIVDKNKPSIYPSKGRGNLLLLNGEKTGFYAYEFEKENIILFQEKIYSKEKSQNHYSLKAISTISPYEIKTLIDNIHTNCMDNGRLLGKKNDVYFFETEVDAPGSYYELFLFNPVNMDFVLIINFYRYFDGPHSIFLYSSVSRAPFNFEKRSRISPRTGEILLPNDNDIEIIFNEKSFTKKEVDQGEADYIKDIFNYNFAPFAPIGTDEINNKESNDSVDAYLKYFPKKIPYFASERYNYKGIMEDFWANPDGYFDFEKNEFISSSNS